jgi:formate hydrogenlyase subunit 3/multisubunit Na+/H+ antiporter MnhD subunit
MNALLACTVFFPLALGLLCVLARGRQPGLLIAAPLPGLLTGFLAVAFAVGAEGAVGSPPGRIHFHLDQVGAMLLTVSSILWLGAGIFAEAWLRTQAQRIRFQVCWLLSVMGSAGVVMAADVVGFLLFFTAASLPAYGLMIHGGSPMAQRAGRISFGVAFLGEGCLMAAFVLLVGEAQGSGPLIKDLVAGLPTSPVKIPILALLLAGFAMKIGAIPFHFWMPLAYPAAPPAAAAVMSGILVKAGVIGLIRFLPLAVPAPDWGLLVVSAGFASAFYGVVIGLAQRDPKAVLAYSSISQMGVIAAILGAGWREGSSDVATIAAFYAANHVLVKGALFLAVGAMGYTSARSFHSRIGLPAAVLALGLAGLPFTGGALAKFAAKGIFVGGLLEGLGALSAVGTAFLMGHFLRRLASEQPPEPASGFAFRGSWYAMAAAALVVPWGIFSLTMPAPLATVLSPGELWSCLWPVLVGGGLALRSWGSTAIPPGDLLACWRPAWFAWLSSQVSRLDAGLREWTVACILLVLMLLALTGLLT